MSNSDPFTLATFAGHVGSRFRITADESVVIDCELIEAEGLPTDDPNRGDNCRSEPFTLLFRISDDLGLGQAMYQLDHEELGTIDLFLVPIGPDKEGKGTCYEAVFN